MKISHPQNADLFEIISDPPVLPVRFAAKCSDALRVGDSLDLVINVAFSLRDEGFRTIESLDPETGWISFIKPCESQTDFDARMWRYDVELAEWTEEKDAALARLGAQSSEQNLGHEKYSNPRYIEFLRLQTEMRELGFLKN